MHPDPYSMYQISEARRAEDIRNAEAFRLAQQVQGQGPNRAKALLVNVIAFARHFGAKSVETTQTAEMPQIKLGGEQP